MTDFDDAEFATLQAALRFYHRSEQGDPFCRTDEIHALATNGDRVAASLDRAGVQSLFRKVQQAARRAGAAPKAAPSPDDEAGWGRLARSRGWPDAALQHAIAYSHPQEHPQGEDLHTYAGPGGECIVSLPGVFAIHTPAWPHDCGYLRVVDAGVGHGVELAYWDAQELRDDPQSVLGAIVGLLAALQRPTSGHHRPGELGSLRSSPTAGVPLDTQPPTADSVAHAQAAVDAYVEAAALPNSVRDDATSAADMLADLMHWSREHELDFDALLASARGYYAEEVGQAQADCDAAEGEDAASDAALRPRAG